MTRRCSNPARPHRWAAGFTLIELLVVIAVISVLLALLLPALRRVRTVAYRVSCGSRLGQIAQAWHQYVDDNNRQFLQRANANYDFGGWKGIIGGALSRPLNKYVGLPTTVQTPGGARLFRCPADEGDPYYGPVAYLYFGNSYQTNFMLIGRGSLPTMMPGPVAELNRSINEHLVNLKADAVCEPSRLLLVGDNNWVTQWEESFDPGRDWHGVRGRYNMAFLDGHLAFTDIHKGVYLDDDYRIQPFKALDEATLALQSQVVDSRGTP